MKIGIYAGSFDPVTKGHLDIIRRSSKIVDKEIVGILVNSEKVSLFSKEEKFDMLKETTKQFDNVEIQYFDGLLVDFAKKCKANIIIRGLRAVTDFEYELQLSQTNKILYNEIDTIFLTTSLQYSYLSSSVVKEVAEYKGDISHFVEPYVAKKIIEKFK
ncbi:MAG: pantetheine-phosphate adenylyltransferase [Eubacteriales bacterium]|nr:pantetheine-phosphate adenylyltransferase [Eubacteriales bacterium]